MAQKIAKPCAYPGCPNVAEPGNRFCLQHRTARRLGDRDYKARRTDLAEQAFYKSERWKRLRKWKLWQDPLCEVCGGPAQVVDHIRPIKEGGDPMTVENLQSLCVRCHNRKHRGGPGG